jgi:cold shock CspA family protein
MSVTSNSSVGAFTGRVKWFNKKSGYGFIVDNTSDIDEVFVYYQNLELKEDGFRYLVEGEYVTFDLQKDESGKVQAVNVRGINGGLLMCESNKSKVSNVNRQSHKYNNKPVLMRRVVKYVPVHSKNNK